MPRKQTHPFDDLVRALAQYHRAPVAFEPVLEVLARHLASFGHGLDDGFDKHDPLIGDLAHAIETDLKAVAGLSQLVMANDDDLAVIDALHDAIDTMGRSATFDHVIEWIDSAVESAGSFQTRIGGFEGPSLVIAGPEGLRPGPGRLWLNCRLSIAAGPFQGDHICWDVYDGPVNDLYEAALAACSHLAPTSLSWQSKAPARLSPVPMFAYHPFRYAQSRDYSRQVSGTSGRSMDQATFDGVSRAMQMEYNERISSLPRRWEAPGTAALSFNRELTLFDAYQRFRHNGRAIFDLDTDLVALFRKTSIADVPLDMISMPYVSLYLHFGRVDDWITPDGWQLTGAYVNDVAQADALEVIMTWHPPTPERVLEWPQRPEPVHKQTFEGETRRMDAGRAMDTLYAARLFDLQEAVNTDHDARVAAAADLESELFGALPAHGPRRLRIATEDRATYETEELKLLQPMAANAMAVVINALVYLTMYPDDRETVWPAGTPQSLADNADNPNAAPRARKRAQDRLAQQGYSRVHLCGLELRERPAPPGKGLSGRPSAHWRRGHWRRQAYGPRASQRRLIWVMPTLVGHKTADDEPLGHIYKTD